VKQNIAEQNVEKVIKALHEENEDDAEKFWNTTVDHSITDKHMEDHLKTIVYTTYKKSPSSFYSILKFLANKQLYNGYMHLHSILVEQNHVYNSEKLFRLANQILTDCGHDTQLYQRFPYVLKSVFSGNFILQNSDNNGYLIAEDYIPCDTAADCFGTPRENVFLFKVYRDQIPTRVLENTRAHWKIVPSDLDSHGFYLKNVAHDSYTVARVHMSGYFLRRDNITFPKYFDKDLQTLFEMELFEGNDDSIRIALMEKRTPRKSYMYGPDFNKDTKISVQRRGGFMKKGLEWKVIPVTIQSMEESKNMNKNMKCPF